MDRTALEATVTSRNTQQHTVTVIHNPGGSEYRILQYGLNAVKDRHRMTKEAGANDTDRPLTVDGADELFRTTTV